MHLSRFHLFLALCALFLLRVTVGYHFFKEGTNKLKYGFDASGFLTTAKGPLAHQFKAMVDDHDGKLRLGVTVDESKEGISSVTVDPQLTLDLWKDFRDRAASIYRFGDPEQINKLKEQRELLAEQIKSAREQGDSAKAFKLETERNQDEVAIKQLRAQEVRSNEILAQASDGLKSWLKDNHTEIVAHYGTHSREAGFDRDGSSKSDVPLGVDSLRYQVESISSDRKKQRYGWFKEIDNMWEAYEGQINSLATKGQIARASTIPTAARPFAPSWSPHQIINAVIPWFDTIVGVLLILGLFTRFASLAAALFLLSVVLTQPPWIAGTTPTYYQCIELVALLVLFATCAGRIAGLDFFLAASAQPSTKQNRKPATSPSEISTTEPATA